MELVWIEDFLALERTRNFTRAANLRNTTQSAYSRRIMRLEEWLGVTLFEREARPVALTHQGEEFLLRAKRLRDDILDARRALLVMSSHFEKPAIRIYTTNTLAISFLPNWIKSQRNIGDYSLVVASVRGCLEALRNGQATMVVVPMIGEDINKKEWNVERIGKDSMALYVNKQIPNHVGVVNGTLKGSVMMYSPQTAYSGVVEQILKEKKVRLAQRPVCESASAEALAAQVAAGLGGAWLPTSLAKQHDATITKYSKGVPLEASFDICVLTPKK